MLERGRRIVSVEESPGLSLAFLPLLASVLLSMGEWSMGADITEGEPGLAIKSLTFTVLFGGLVSVLDKPKYLSQGEINMTNKINKLQQKAGRR